MKRIYLILMVLLYVLNIQCEAKTDMWVWQNGQYKRYKDVDSILYTELEDAVYDKISGHCYVDLGLPSGLLFATCNVGASKPNDYGYYYAWGEKDEHAFYYNQITYSFYDVLHSTSSDPIYTKYVIDKKYGVVDNLTTLESKNDVATAQWGSRWRIPTQTEFQELIDGCDWFWTGNYRNSGVGGQIGVSKVNGNVIFLPAGGHKWDKVDIAADRGFTGSYWSSSLCTASSGEAEILKLGYNGVFLSTIYRYWGLNVRPVTKIYFTVNFYDKDSTLIESQKVKYSESVTTPELNGYNMGWSDSSFVNVQKDLDVYACKNKYIVNFYTEDSVLIGSQKVDSAQSATTASLAIPNLVGYVFVGWNDSSFVSVSKHMNIYARYKQGVAESGQIGTHSFIDLGLPSGLKWATCNVGATKQIEDGNYYAWGETEPKDSYSWSNYKWCEGSSNTLTKYGLDSTYGTVDSLTVLEAADDAATTNWGAEWRMPTVDEMNELINGCNWLWVSNYNESGVSGSVATSKVNGNTIFFPAAGGYEDSVLIDKGTVARYLSSSLKTSNDLYYLKICNKDADTYYGSCREYGRLVRAVSMADTVTINTTTADTTTTDTTKTDTVLVDSSKNVTVNGK